MKIKKKKWRDANEVIRATILPIKLDSVEIEMRKNRSVKDKHERSRTNSRLK